MTIATAIGHPDSPTSSTAFLQGLMERERCPGGGWNGRAQVDPPRCRSRHAEFGGRSRPRPQAPDQHRRSGNQREFPLRSLCSLRGRSRNVCNFRWPLTIRRKDPAQSSTVPEALRRPSRVAGLEDLSRFGCYSGGSVNSRISAPRAHNQSVRLISECSSSRRPRQSAAAASSP